MKFMVLGCLCGGAMAAIACADGRGVPTSPTAIAAVSGLAATAPGNGETATLAPSSSAFPRSGALQVTKECSKFETDSYCTITSSSLEAIEVGSRIVYLQPADLSTPSGSGVTLDLPARGNADLPGRGHNTAAGHCALDPQDDYRGLCTFSGGTGTFTWFHARVDVSHNADFSKWYWEGTYSFSPKD